MIGQTVSHYRILSELGAGGMGVVYEAEDTRLDRKVALKFLAPELTRDPAAHRRFVNEAKAASSLEHPAICTIHEIDQDNDGRTFMVMPRYTGQTLQERLDAGPLPVDEAVNIALQLARGMTKAHGEGIVHRDLKPGNIFVTADGNVVILDFGLAKLSGATKVTREGTTLGTPAYLSPEQSRGQEADTRSDVWALGVVLHEMLAGRLPFQGEHPQALIYAIQNEAPPPLADVPEPIAQIVTRCLDKDPAQRYADANQLRDDLERVVGGEGLRPWLPSTRAPGRTRRWLQWLAPLVLVATLVGIKLLQDGKQAPVPVPEDRKSIAVMPFQNLTGDDSYDVWTLGLPELLNVELENSQELQVLSTETLQKLLADLDLAQAAVISVPQMRDVAERTLVETLITGSLMKAGETLRIQLKLLDAGTGAALATMRVDGRSEDDFFVMADSLTAQVRDFLEIDALKQWNPEFDWVASGTQSAEAYRLFIEGEQARRLANWPVALDRLNRAVTIDSTFWVAWMSLAGSTANSGDVEGYFAIHEKLREQKNRMPLLAQYHLELNWGRESNGCDRGAIFARREIIQKLLAIDPEDRGIWFYLGTNLYFNQQYEEAADAFARSEEICRRWGNHDLSPPGLYHWFGGESFYRAGRLEEANEVFTRALGTPIATYFELWLAIVSFAQGDYVQADMHLQQYDEKMGKLRSGDHLSRLTGFVSYHAAVGNVQQALVLCDTILAEDPEDHQIESARAYLLIENEIDVDQGVELLEGILERYPELESPDARIGAPWGRWYMNDYQGNLGWGYYKQGRYDLAVERLEAACAQWFTFEATLANRLEQARAALAREQKR